MAIDLQKCRQKDGCDRCIKACHFTHNVPRFADRAHEVKWIWKEPFKNVFPAAQTGYTREFFGELPVLLLCNHCDDPPCLAAARDGAVTKRADGIVLIDPVRARGQKPIVDACPYGHVWWNEELQLPQSWPFDAHLLDNGWVHTRGDQACPTGAMRSVKLEDVEMAQLAATEGLETLHPEFGTQPRVYYKNLWRYATCFIGGTVSVARDGVVDCLEGARVELAHDGQMVATLLTDNYGDFKFDRLEEGSGAYRVQIEAPGLGIRVVDVALGESMFVGEIRF